MKKMKNLVSMFLANALTLALFAAYPMDVLAAPGSDLVITGGTLGTDYSYAENPASSGRYALNIIQSGTYTISMAMGGTTTTTDRIVVASGVTANITLDGVSIDRTSDMSNTISACAFAMTGATVDLTLVGTNTLKSNSPNAGLYAPYGSTLVIGGIGSLEAVGGSGGIGGSSLVFGVNGGTITISGGTQNCTVKQI